jgi:hypothetical protein
MVFLSGSALFSLCFEPGGKCPEILRQVGNAPTENRELLVEILNVFIDNLVFDFLYFMSSAYICLVYPASTHRMDIFSAFAR